MGMISEDALVEEFARRTLVNLNFILDQKSADGPYEVTQIINSSLGLMIVPHERVFTLGQGRINISALDSVRRKISTLTFNSQADDAYGFLRMLRHGFSHGNFKFHPSEQNPAEIGSIIIWNYDQGGNINWRVKIKIQHFVSIIKIVASSFAEE